MTIVIPIHIKRANSIYELAHSRGFDTAFKYFLRQITVT